MLSKEQENMLKVRSVVATMAIEDMYLDNEFIDKLLKVMNGELSSDELNNPAPVSLLSGRWKPQFRF